MKKETPNAEQTDVSMRDLLAKAAFELFSESGFKEVNLDQIAARAGVTKGSLYWHYPSKGSLIQAACEYYYALWFERAGAVVAQPKTPVLQLEAVLRMSTQQCLMDVKNRLFTSELFIRAMQDKDVREGWQRFVVQVHQFYCDRLEAIIETENISIDAPSQNIDWVLAAMEGIKQRAVFNPEICNPVEQENIVRRLVQTALGK